MKKNGFTLVELLAVIAILSTILGLVVILAIKLSDARREIDYDNIKQIMVDSARTMIETGNDNDDSIDDKIKSSCVVSYSQLVNKGYMNNEIKNPTDNEELNNTCVKIHEENYKYIYEFLDDCSSLPNCLN